VLQQLNLWPAKQPAQQQLSKGSNRQDSTSTQPYGWVEVTSASRSAGAAAAQQVKQ
jgi:hypothetical protein